MKDDIENMADTILRICKDRPWVRGCYWRLYYEYLIEEGIAFTSPKGGYYIPFKKTMDMPSPESISRTYRELRKTHPEIEPETRIREFREQNKQEMDHIPVWFPTLNGSRAKQTNIIDF
jgi:hypothetical protein